MADEVSSSRGRQNLPATTPPASTSPASTSDSPPGSRSALSGVNVRLTAILGGTELTFDEAVELDPDTLITVDRSQDEPVDLCVNGKVVARGKLVVVGDTYGVQVTELVDSKA